MHRQDFYKFKRIKTGPMCSIGMFDCQCILENLTGFADIPVYYPISREEFDSFDSWKEDFRFIVAITSKRLDYRKFKRVKTGQMCSVGMIDYQCVFEITTGAFYIPVYYPISQEEFDSFDDWKESTLIIREITLREYVASAYNTR